MHHELPTISAAEATPLVMKLMALIDSVLKQNDNLLKQNDILLEKNLSQAEGLQQMRDEIAVLKGQKAKPKFKSSKMDKNTDKDDDKGAGGDGDGEKKRAGSAKRSKTAQLKIHEDLVVAPQEPVPPDARFKGYRDFVIQGLVIKAHNVRYRLECWQANDGTYLVGQLPAALQGHHFDPILRSYILYQHHHCHVTQPLLLEQLGEWDIDISAGQVDAILSAGKEAFHEEKNDVLMAGLEVSRYVTVDDSGARHQGKNGYVLQIGNELFGWFSSTNSKSRINFLEQLHAGSITYEVTEEAMSYMTLQGLKASVLEQLRLATQNGVSTALEWNKHLSALDIKGERHVQIATEGALLGSLLEKGFNPELVILSDGAGQFAILLHALCWIHAERLIDKLIPVNDQQRQAIALVRDQVWALYADLKVYKAQPDADKIVPLEARFDAVFTQTTGYDTLDKLLQRHHSRKSELLLVLKRPEIPLHTNGSETDIRDFVKKRKVSGGTRSDLGRQCRDTFASLKKTCRKQSTSFWKYLVDRVSLANVIPPLPTLVRAAAIRGALP